MSDDVKPNPTELTEAQRGEERLPGTDAKRGVFGEPGITGGLGEMGGAGANGGVQPDIAKSNAR
jgi:hypothetical protein